MSADIPAAHSMDSTWFAVDEDGHIAVFETDEGGALPAVPDFPMGGEAGGKHPLEEADLFAALVLLRALQEPRLRAALPEDPDEAARLLSAAYWEADGEGAALLGAVGAFRFIGDYGGVPYERENEVGSPVRVDQLPEPLRSRLQGAKLPVRFGQIRILAPGEFVPVESWSRGWVDTAGKEHKAGGPPTGRPPGARDAPEEAAELEPALALAALIEAITELVELGRDQVRADEAAEAARQERASAGFFGWLKSLFGG